MSQLAFGETLQVIAPRSKHEQFEGVAFSSCGNILGVATAGNNTVELFRRKTDKIFENSPFCTIGGPTSGVSYPHDVAFSTHEGCELLAVAQRRGAITIYGKNLHDSSYGPHPIFEISGSASKLALSDGVAFVPPSDEYLAACNLLLGTISFFRKISLSPLVFETSPTFELRHPSIFHPDGLSFSSCGKWLAVANHGRHSVCIFRRCNEFLSGGALSYGPEPITIIEDPQFCYPHSVAFIPHTNHLLVTDAGANFLSVYAPRDDYSNTKWSQSPALRKIFSDVDTFRRINALNKMEGGPKGVAIHENTVAVCSPQTGVNIYSLQVRPELAPIT